MELLLRLVTAQCLPCAVGAPTLPIFGLLFGEPGYYNMVTSIVPYFPCNWIPFWGRFWVFPGSWTSNLRGTFRYFGGASLQAKGFLESTAESMRNDQNVNCVSLHGGWNGVVNKVLWTYHTELPQDTYLGLQRFLPTAIVCLHCFCETSFTGWKDDDPKLLFVCDV